MSDIETARHWRSQKLLGFPGCTDLAKHPERFLECWLALTLLPAVTFNALLAHLLLHTPVSLVLGGIGEEYESSRHCREWPVAAFSCPLPAGLKVATSVLKQSLIMTFPARLRTATPLTSTLVWWFLSRGLYDNAWWNIMCRRSLTLWWFLIWSMLPSMLLPW